MKIETGLKIINIMNIILGFSTLLVVYYHDLEIWASLLLGGCAGLMISCGIMNYPVKSSHLSSQKQKENKS